MIIRERAINAGVFIMAFILAAQNHLTQYTLQILGVVVY